MHLQLVQSQTQDLSDLEAPKDFRGSPFESLKSAIMRTPDDVVDGFDFGYFDVQEQALKIVESLPEEQAAYKILNLRSSVEQKPTPGGKYFFKNIENELSNLFLAA